MASALECGDVHKVLSYIHSRSAIPEHLFSLPSRQRHHFLNIDHDDPYEYLAWPSPDSRLAVDRLLDYSIDDFQPNLSVAYTTDSECAFAHCHLRTIRDDSSFTPDLRLVFQWDISCNQWKFHNTALMPFPPGSLPSLSQSTTMAPIVHDDFLQEPEAVHIESDNDDDAYWNAYGRVDDDDDDGNSASIAADPKADNQVANEDAYWAQYAVVQGSGDSTQPSPLPNKRNKSNHLPSDPANPHLQPHSRNEPITFSYSALNPPSKNQDLPSPNTLTERLNAISARTSTSPLDDPESPESQGSDNNIANNLNTMSDSDSSSPSPPPGLVRLGVKSAGSPERRIPIDLSVVTSSSPPFQNLGRATECLSKERQFGSGSRSSRNSGAFNSVEGAEALKESIRGVYRLWRAGKRASPPNGVAKLSEKEIFLDLVRQAIQES